MILLVELYVSFSCRLNHAFPTVSVYIVLTYGDFEEENSVENANNLDYRTAERLQFLLSECVLCLTVFFKNIALFKNNTNFYSIFRRVAKTILLSSKPSSCLFNYNKYLQHFLFFIPHLVAAISKFMLLYCIDMTRFLKIEYLA